MSVPISRQRSKLAKVFSGPKAKAPPRWQQWILRFVFHLRDRKQSSRILSLVTKGRTSLTRFRNLPSSTINKTINEHTNQKLHIFSFFFLCCCLFFLLFLFLALAVSLFRVVCRLLRLVLLCFVCLRHEGSVFFLFSLASSSSSSMGFVVITVKLAENSLHPLDLPCSWRPEPPRPL